MLSASPRSTGLLLFAIFLWGTLAPYPFWGQFYLLIPILLVTLILFLVAWDKPYNIKVYKVMHSAFVSLLVLMFHMLNGASVGWAGLIALSTLVMLNCEDEVILSGFLFLRKIFAVTLLPGIAVWVLFVAGVDVSMMSIGYVQDEIVPTQLKVDAGISYILFPGSVMLDYMQYWPVFRFQGWFDEPGVVGTMAIFFLIAGQFDLKNKENMLIFFAGLISLSLSFYILLLLYGFINIRRFWRGAFVLCLFISVVLAFSPTLSEALGEKVFNRLHISDDLELAGDNRMTQSDLDLWEGWKSGSTFVFFMGTDGEISGSSGWRNIFIKAGALGFTLIWLVYFIIYLRKAMLSWHVGSFVVVLVFSFLQRPTILMPVFLFLFLVVLAQAERESIVLNKEG